MAWECRNCGNRSPDNPKGMIGFVLLDHCGKCHEPISPFILHKEADDNNFKYISSLLAFNYIKKKTNPPIGEKLL